MNVKELIEALENIEDKTLEVRAGYMEGEWFAYREIDLVVTEPLSEATNKTQDRYKRFVAIR